MLKQHVKCRSSYTCMATAALAMLAVVALPLATQVVHKNLAVRLFLVSCCCAAMYHAGRAGCFALRALVQSTALHFECGLSRRINALVLVGFFVLVVVFGAVDR